MCSGTQPKLFGGAQPLGSGGNFQAPITYQGGAPQNFDAGNPASFPKPELPPQPPMPGLPEPPMPNPRFRFPFGDDGDAGPILGGGPRRFPVFE